MNKSQRCDGFQCGRQCIPQPLVCNGINECFDGSDEQYCGKSTIYAKHILTFLFVLIPGKRKPYCQLK